MWRGIAAARLGGRVSDISHAVETHVARRGSYGILEDYVGHGIGSEMHQPPNVPNFGRPGRGPKLVRGLALAVEPMVTLGRKDTDLLDDDWTVVTPDGSWAAHFEHTFTLTPDGAWVLTALDGGEAALGELGVPVRRPLTLRAPVCSRSRCAHGTMASAGGEYSLAAVSSSRRGSRSVPGAVGSTSQVSGRVGGRDLRSHNPSAYARACRRHRGNSGGELLNAFMGDSVASPTVWLITIVVTVGVLLVDLLIIGRRPHEPSMNEVSLHLGLLRRPGDPLRARLWIFAEPHELSPNPGPEFFAGWLTEYSLSIDNLFIFIIIMASSRCPRRYQQTALMIGIVLALIMRADLHRGRRRGDQPVQLDLLHLRPVPLWTAWKLAKEGAAGRRRVRGEQARPVRREAPPGHQGVARHQAHRQGGRQAADHADVPGDPDARHHRPAVRARLDPGDLRPDQGPVHRLHRQHLRADGSAPALLPHRRAAAAPDLPVLRAGVPARLHRRQADPARHARERAAVHQRRRARRVGPGHPDLALAWSSSAPSRSPPSPAWPRTGHDGRGPRRRRSAE